MTPDDVERVDQDDALSGAAVFCCLVMAMGIVSVLARASLGHALLTVMSGLQLTAAVIGIAYLARARERLSTRDAQIVTISLASVICITEAVAASGWYAMGRPWEAFAVIEFTMLAVGMTGFAGTRASYIVVLVAFIEAVLVTAYLYHRGERSLRAPTEQPLTVTVYAIVAMACLLARASRRKITLSHVAAQSHSVAERQIEWIEMQLREAFDPAVRAAREMADALAGQATVASGLAGRLVRSTYRLTGLTEALWIATDETAGGERTQSAGGDLLAGVLANDAAATDLELRLYAREAQRAAMVQCALFFVIMLAAATGYRKFPLGTVLNLWLIQAAIAGCFALALYRTRHRPSELRAVVAFTALMVPCVFSFALAQSAWAQIGMPFEPLAGAKFALVLAPLLVARHIRLGLVVQTVFLIESLVIYAALDLAHMRDRIPLAEPWWTMVFAAIGFGQLAMREFQRVAAARVLRSDVSRAAAAERARRCLTLLDLFGSPLQSLTTDLALARFRATETESIDAMKREVVVMTVALRWLTVQRMCDARSQITAATAPTITAA